MTGCSSGYVPEVGGSVARLGAAAVTCLSPTVPKFSVNEVVSDADLWGVVPFPDVASRHRTSEVTMPLLAAVTGEDALDRTVRLAHRHLRLDAVYIAELTGSELVFRAVAGDASMFDIKLGRRLVAEETVGHYLAAGVLPALIPDVANDPFAAALPAVRAAGIGCLVGVPLRLGDGGVYGTFCAVSREPDPTLDDRDVRFLELLAELLSSHLDETQTARAVHEQLTDIIDAERLDVAAQPIISLRDGDCLGIEALSRFPSMAAGPAEVFAAADRAGLGVELERLAVRRALPLLDLLEPEQFLTVNLSPAAAATLSVRAATYANLPLSRLVVEITEHSMIDGYDDLRELLRPLRQRGLRVAVDDAGAGYASLRHVVELRPDFIKIDRDLIHGIADDHARRVTVSAFVLLALDLNATVIAEGLEQPRDLATLCDLGVDAAQGYLLGKPTTDLTQIRRGLQTLRALTDARRHRQP